MKNERYVYVDILKGIAILLVVYSHVIPGVFPKITEYITTFHMPLFFFVSGFLFDNEKYKINFVFFLKKRCRSLLIPFIYFSIIVLLGYYFIEHDYLHFLFDHLINGWGGYALWFIPVLFLSQIIYYPLSILNSLRWRLMGLIMLVLVSYISSSLIGYFPYNLLFGFCGAYFFGVGNLLKIYIAPIINKTNEKSAVIFGCIAFLFSLLYLSVNNRPEWFINNIPSLLFYIVPFGAIFCLILVSLFIDRKGFVFLIKFFSICGKQSYIILAFHQIICMLASLCLPSKVIPLIMIVSLAFLVWFIPKYLPWLLGNVKK